METGGGCRRQDRQQTGGRPAADRRTGNGGRPAADAVSGTGGGVWPHRQTGGSWGGCHRGELSGGGDFLRGKFREKNP